MTSNSYHARFARVLEYIDTHLEEALSVECLSEVAAFSKYHFHRQFSGLFGIGVSKYVQLVRMKRATCVSKEHGSIALGLPEATRVDHLARVHRMAKAQQAATTCECDIQHRL